MVVRVRCVCEGDVRNSVCVPSTIQYLSCVYHMFRGWSLS